LERGAIEYLTQRDKSARIPQHAIDALARCLLPEIQAFFESNKGKKICGMEERAVRKAKIEGNIGEKKGQVRQSKPFLPFLVFKFHTVNLAERQMQTLRRILSGSAKMTIIVYFFEKINT